ncbi:MAG: hypothetical protein AAGA01_18690 [Cyanobacteria bacterium P01_E01_bin.43]
MTFLEQGPQTAPDLGDFSARIYRFKDANLAGTASLKRGVTPQRAGFYA